MTRSSRDPLYSLQIGRALAALAVVFQHAATAVKSAFPDMPDALYALLHLGYFGIDYFFVLSGFIIAHVTHDMAMNRTSAIEYVRSRVIRIYVPYLPISLAMLVVFLWLPSISHGVREQIGILGSLTLLPDLHPPALAVAWTLQHEIVFYALFALCFFYFKRPALIYAWALAMLIPFFIPVGRAGSILVNLINIEFLLGVAACQLYHAQRLYRFRHMLVFGGLILIVGFASIVMRGAVPHDQMHRILGLGCAMLVLGLVHLERTVNFKRYRVLVFLGAASYAIYLIHGPAMSVFARVADGLPHWSLALVVLVGLSTLVGVAYHLGFEKPATAWVKRRWQNGRNDRI